MRYKGGMETVWVMTGQKIKEAQFWAFDYRGAILVMTSSGAVRIGDGRWFKTKRAAQLALSRKRRLKA